MQAQVKEIKPGQMIKNFCCLEFDWKVCFLLDETVWGVCHNPDCPQICGCGEPCYYDGVSSFEVDDCASLLTWMGEDWIWGEPEREEA
jgi:hypothetical protein